MNKLQLSTLALLLILNSCAVAQSIETRIQQVIDSAYKANPAVVGIMLHLEAPDRDLSWSGASGLPEKGAQYPLEPDQPALIASNIKTYVAATILRLAEMEKLSTDQSIGKLLTKKTRKLFESGGYDLQAIEIKHLLSHTSGIQDYADDDYIDFIDSNKTYRWTRDEQLERTLERGGPLGPPGSTYSYTDANYLLLTEIIEGITGRPFYTSMRELLKYGELGLNDTWMPTLEKKPEGTKSLVHQYWDEMSWDSYDIDVSTDLYGGGGIACPPKDMARFYWSLFNGRIVQDTAVLNLIFTVVPTADAEPAHYYFGLSPYEIHGVTGYGHGGFWGTVAVYFPELNASIAVCTLERSMRMVRNALMDRVVAILLETTEDR